MMYNPYILEKMANEIQRDRINEAKRYSRWATARRAMRELSKNLAAR